MKETTAFISNDDISQAVSMGLEAGMAFLRPKLLASFSGDEEFLGEWNQCSDAIKDGMLNDMLKHVFECPSVASRFN